MTGNYPVARSSMEAYSFVKQERGELAQLVDRGLLPWWSDPELHAVGFRPLGSGLLLLDHRAELTPLSKHVHTLAWWFLLLFGYALLAHVLFPKRIATVGLFLYALSPVHAVPIGWIANRVSVASTALAVFTVFGHVWWRSGHGRAGLWIAVASGISSVLTSEYGLGVYAFLVAYELTRRDRTSLRVFAVVAVSTAAYLALRSGCGAGVVGSVMYTDPLVEPAEFLSGFAARVPALVLQLFFQVPCEFSAGILSASTLKLRAVSLALVLAPAIIATVWLTKRRRTEAWLLAATFGAIIPLLSVEPNARLLQLPAVGTSLTVAAVTCRLFSLMSKVRLARTLAATVAAIVLTVIHLPLAAALTLSSSSAWFWTAKVAQERVDNDRIFAGGRGSCFVLLNARDIVSLYSVPQMLSRQLGAPPDCWFALASSSGRVQVSRSATNSLMVTASPGAALLDSPISQFVRVPKFTRNQMDDKTKRVFGRMAARVRTAANGEPTQVQFDFSGNALLNRVTLLHASRSGFRVVPTPAVGGTVSD
ncbi:MAG: hypothetical protein R3B13_37295 [Polyangiaceae bacterium]